MKSFYGRVKMINKIFFILLISFNAFGEDAGQMMMDEIENRAEIEKSIKNIEEDDDSGSSFLQGSVPGSVVTDIEEEASNELFLSQENPVITYPTKRDYALENGQKIIEDTSIPNDRLIEATNREIVKEVSNQKSKVFSFYYIRDDYDIKDSRGVFQQTYVDDQSAVRGGSLMFSLERALYNSWINILWGANAGFGLSQGNGRFVDGTRSDAKFSLWTLPVELGLTLEIPISNWFTLSAEAGPSAMGLYQVRSDFESGAKGKRRRQVGTGYYAEAKFKLSLSNIFSGTGFDYFSEYGISNTYLDIIARMQDYGNFQDDITITGQSLGIGFTFDYL